MSDFVGIVADYVHQFRQILHREGGGLWRKMADFVGIMTDFVHQFGQILHRERGGKWRILSEL